MNNKRFISTFAMMFILFVAMFGSTGCIGSDHKTFVNNGTFTVTFDSNGGSEVPSQKVEAGGTVTMPDNPTKDDYIFAGWFKDNNTFSEMFVFGEGGDRVSEDITLYADWVEYDTLITEYAINEVVIGYSRGDSANHVTGNLTLPTKVGSTDISWGSSSGAVSSNGTVTRQAEDTDVTLTATANYNGKESEPKTFNVKVIRKRTRDNSKIEALTIQEASSGDVSITRSASGDVRDIDGMYVKFDINNADDALDAVTVLRDELGIKNPSEELETFLVTSDKYSSEYAFLQVHKGVRVWGRNLVVSTNSSSKGDFLHSSFLNSDVVAKADGKNDIGSSVADSKAKDNYSEEVEVDPNFTEKVIYSLEDYENEPVYAYIVRVYTTSGDKYIDESVFVNANTGEIINIAPNTFDAFDMREASGTNEFGKQVSFDVVYELVKPTVLDAWHLAYVMREPNLYIQLYESFGFNLTNIPVTSFSNTWPDKHQVSVYSNMCKIMQWWKKEFNRDSLDGKGTKVDIVTHAWGKTDNAAWTNIPQRIHTYDRAEVSSLDHFCGSASDVLTHETTHAILQYITGGGLHKNAAGAINEGYSDVFACIRDRNWQIGEMLFDSNNKYKLNCMRNIATPSDTKAKSRYGLKAFAGLYEATEVIYQYYEISSPGDDNDQNMVHELSHKVSHAAYLMHVSNDVNGLTWKQLGDVWYKSMHKGLDSTSKFEDVQRCVMAAARELGLSSQKRFVMESAFSQLGYGSKSMLTGTVTDYDTKSPILDVIVNARTGKSENKETLTDEEGYFSMRVPIGNCSVTLKADKYVTFATNLKLDSSKVLDVQLVKSGPGSVSGTVYQSDSSIIYDDTRNYPPLLEGVTVKIRSGFDNKDGEALQTTTTDSNGRYSFDLGENGAGYYTIEMTKKGYVTSTFNITVSRSTTAQDVILLWDLNSNDNPEQPDTPDNPENHEEPESHDNPSPTVADVPIDEEHFPDEKFRDYVQNNFDTNKDNILSVAEIGEVKKINVYNGDNKLHYNGTTISSLKGIEYFHALKYLNCYGHQLTVLDISHNVALEYLNCSWNQLTTLDVSKNVALQNLDCYINELYTLDVSKNTALQNLNCSDNELYTLDVSKNTALQFLSCSNNELHTLDVSKNTALRELHCYTTKLSTLDVSKNTALRKITCSHNQLAALDVSKNTALKLLCCYNNNLTVLDLSNCPQLNSDNVQCDDVNITWPSSSASPSTHLKATPSHSSHNNTKSTHSDIVVVLPEFKADYSGIYSFDVSFDIDAPSGSVLIMRLSSDDESPENESCIFLDKDGSQIEMPLTSNLDHVKVSAYFDSGVTYSPVIVAQTDESLSNSGGCNAGIFGIFILLSNLVLLKKR